MRFSTSSQATLPLLSTAVTLSLLSTTAQAGAAPGEYEVVQEDSLASAMMLFLMGDTTAVILDKVEGNAKLDDSNQPIFGSLFNLEDNTVRGVATQTNAFCASGLALGNGTHMVAGGNNAAGVGGALAEGGAAPYYNYDGRKAVRLMDYNSDPSQLYWNDGPNGNQMASYRWYPGIEGLADGSVVLIGGYINGGYINRNYPNIDPAYEGTPGASTPDNMQGGANPTYEHWPAKDGDMQVNDFMVKTSGLNSYAHTFLLPSGRIFMQANYSTTIWDSQSNTFEDLPDMTDRVVRVYPASGAVAMLPLTKENNYTPTILFCGGTNGLDDQGWGSYAGPATNTLDITASTDCSSITPENADGTTNTDAAYDSEEQMKEGRTMGQFIHLPTGQMVIVNGANKGTAGYYNTSFNILDDGTQTEGLAQDPTYTPLLYDPAMPKGSRLTDAGFGASTIARLYHSSALLLPDGSVLVGGSNPHVDVVQNMPVGTTPTAYNTTYELEKWYPSYFFKDRPMPTNLPTQIGYGGNYFNISMDADYMGGNANYKAANTKIMIIRPGFSTHAMNMGQRSMQLEHSYEVHSDNSVTYMVNPLPNNPNLIVPGPALIFVTIDGIPSKGKHLMIGDLGGKPVPANPTIGSALVALPAAVNSTTSSNSASDSGDDSSSFIDSFGLGKLIGIIAGAVVVVLLLLLGICLWRRKASKKGGDHSPLDGGMNNRASMLGVGVGGMAGWANRGDSNGKYDRVNTPASSVHNLGSYGMENVSRSSAASPYLDSPDPGQGSRYSQNSNLGRSPLVGHEPMTYHQGGSSHGWSEYQAEGDAGQYYSDGRGAGNMYHQGEPSDESGFYAR